MTDRITLTRTVTYTTFECKGCGVPYALSDDYVEQRRNDHKTWCCPNGCRFHYAAENETEKALRRAVRAEANAAQLRAEKDQLEMSRRAYKGQVTKIRRRVSNGVCPCCTRTFANVARHIKSKHPEFVEEPEAL